MIYADSYADVVGDLAFNEDLGMLAEGSESEWVTNIFKGIKQSSFVRGVKCLHDLLWWFVDDVVMNLPEARRAVGETLQFTNERLERRLNSDPARPDLWSQIIAKGVGEQALDRVEHQGLAFFFMVAGTETTASALSAITFFLLSNSSYTSRLREELRSAFSTFDDLTIGKLGRLKYLNAVIQEGLRMYPPVPIALPRRTPAGGAQVDGTYIPGDVVCSIPHYSTYRNAVHFHEPDEFRPERWLGDPKYKDDNLDAVEPFHVGPRNCVGKNSAWHELRLFLATTYTFFDLELMEKSQNWFADNRVFTVWEKPPLWCRVKAAGKT
jgi:cytochrome P450